MRAIDTCRIYYFIKYRITVYLVLAWKFQLSINVEREIAYTKHFSLTQYRSIYKNSIKQRTKYRQIAIHIKTNFNPRWR